MDDRNKLMQTNYLLPDCFIESWKNKKTNSFTYLEFNERNFSTVEIENIPFIEKIFFFNNSFDQEKIREQFQNISKVAKKIVELRILQKDEIGLTKEEIIFLKYFKFLISILNGDYKFYFDGGLKGFKTSDILIPNKLKEFEIQKILLVINYILFDLYDFIFTNNLFSETLDDYVNKIDKEILKHETYKKIIINDEEIRNNSFRFIQVYFHQFMVNTFLKFFTIKKENDLAFYLTNKAVSIFIDEFTKATLLDIMIVDPYLAIGFVNLGPGSGEYRPFFQYFLDSKVNKVLIPMSLLPEHKIYSNGIYLDNNQKYFFKSFDLTLKQIKVINESLTYNNLLFDIETFYRNIFNVRDEK